MKKIVFLICVLTGIILLTNNNFAQTSEEWNKDINILVERIEKYHPMPWYSISREEFLEKAKYVKTGLVDWDKKKIIIEIMKLVASLKDGHTQVFLDNQECFNLWFPIRLEKFDDGVFITASDKKNVEFIGAKVLKIGNFETESAYRIVSDIIATNSDYGIARRITNFLSNAVILNKSGVIGSNTLLPLEVQLKNGELKKIKLESSEWMLSFNWAYDKKNVPTKNEIRAFFSDKDSLPIYLSTYIKSPNDPFCFQYILEDSMIYFQLNQVFDGNKESLLDFTKKVFSLYDDKTSEIDKFVIDLRFNEGGNTSLIPAIVEQFKQRSDSFKKCKLFIITGNSTFSAATAFIGQMLKSTNVITVGDIADGPLNFSSDPVMFFLQKSDLLMDISRLFLQDGHPTDHRGYYPPDYYIPYRSKDYFSFNDPILDAIKENKVKSLKNILYNEGSSNFKEEFEQREKTNGPVKKWFPYTSYDLALYAFNDLIPSEKYEEAVEISKLNTVIYPESIWGWFILGIMYENKGEVSEALRCYNQLLEIEPYHVEAKWARDKLLAMAEPVSLATSQLEKYVGDFEDRKILLEKGQLKYQVGDDEKRKLTPISETCFLIENSNYRVVFMMKNNISEMLKVIKWDGKTRLYKRQ